MSKKQWPQKLFWAIVDDMTIGERLQVVETIIRRERIEVQKVENDTKAHAGVYENGQIDGRT